MADILFVTWDGGGNVPPATALARELLDRGHTVRFLGHASQAPALRAEGFEVVHPSQARDFSSQVHNSPFAIMACFGDRGMGQDLLTEVSGRPADLVVIDCLMVGALHAAHEAGLRYAVLEHCYDGYYQRGILGGPLGLYLSARRLRPRAALDAAALRVVTTLPDLDPITPRPENVRQVGPVVTVAADSGSMTPPASGEPPTILVSLSTFAFPGMTRSLQAIVDATADLAARVVITTGPAIDPEDLRTRPGVEVHRYVPHAELMPHAHLFVGHGGHGSTMQALAHGLPCALMPMDKTADQPMVAASVAAAGAGRVLAKKATPEQIAPVLAELVSDGPHRANAARLGAAIRALPGRARGADAIEELIGRSVSA